MKAYKAAIGHVFERGCWENLYGSNLGRKIPTNILNIHEKPKTIITDAAKAYSSRTPYQATSFHLGDQPKLLFPFSRPESFHSIWVNPDWECIWLCISSLWKDPMFCRSVGSDHTTNDTRTVVGIHILVLVWKKKSPWVIYKSILMPNFRFRSPAPYARAPRRA